MINQISFPTAANELPQDSVAVVLNFYAGLFGGPIFQLLKCLTAVKICDDFKKNGIAAVPVCLVRQDAAYGFSTGEIHLLDHSSKLHCLKSSGREEGTHGTIIGSENAKKLLSEIEKIFPYGDREALTALKEAFTPDTNSVSSCVCWLKYLLKDYGVTVVEHDVLSVSHNARISEQQSLTLPIAVFVADLAEIMEYDKMSSELEYVQQPIVRYYPHVTIANTRSMKTLKRYGLDFERLFDGKQQVMYYVRDAMKSDVPGRLKKLRDETGTVLDELTIAAFGAQDERSVRFRSERAARIIYQLEKIHRHSRDALANKEATAKNRLCRVCDFLAPLGRRQQDVLCGAQIPISYGLTGLRAIYECLDITTSNHQLIVLN